jgi:hypothetical protein
VTSSVSPTEDPTGFSGVSEPHAPGDTVRADSILSDPERLLKILGGAAIAVFIIGFVCVNAYLLSLGASDYSLTRPRFIATGVLFLAALSFSCLPATIAKAVLRRTAGMVTLIVSFVLATIVSMAVLSGALASTGVDIADACLSAFRLTAIGVVSALASMYGLRGHRRDISITALGFALVIMSFGFFLAGFLDLFYSKIPSQFGGGRPRDIVLILSEDAAPRVREAGLSVCPGALRTSPVALLYESETDFVIHVEHADGSDRVVVMGKELAVAVVTRDLPPC